MPQPASRPPSLHRIHARADGAYRNDTSGSGIRPLPAMTATRHAGAHDQRLTATQPVRQRNKDCHPCSGTAPPQRPPAKALHHKPHLAACPAHTPESPRMPRRQSTGTTRVRLPCFAMRGDTIFRRRDNFGDNEKRA